MQPAHLAMLTNSAAVTTRTQVRISLFWGNIFHPFLERFVAEHPHASPASAGLNWVICV